MVRVPSHRAPTHPGEMLLEEFLKPLEISQSELSTRIHVPYQRVNELVNGKRGVTPATALRLAKLFGTTPAFWMNLQHRLGEVVAVAAVEGDVLLAAIEWRHVNETPHRHESRDRGDEARNARSRARQDWPIRRYRLGAEPSDDLSAAATPGQLVAMVWPLTVLSWRLAGLEIPDYERRHAPGAVRRSRGAA